VSDDSLSPTDRDRIARILWGAESLDAAGHFYVRSSGEEVAILRERIRELQSLATGGIQQIQLDLIRSCRFNAFVGERIVRDLLAHRSLWVSALIDRFGEPGGLIKLRDLPQNDWNVDTLYVLARDKDCARELVESSAEWAADSVDVYNAERTARAIGCSATEARVIAWWWD